MPQTPTPNMGLIKPTDLGDNGVWATLIDAIVDAVDAHSHGVGSGVRITPAAISITSDLNFLSSAATNAKAVKFSPQLAVNVSAYTQGLFVLSTDGELYWRTSGGSNVKLTSGTSINASLLGGLQGDYASVGADAGFTDAADTYYFKQQIGGGVKQYARMQCSDVDLYEFKANPAAGVPTTRVRHKSPTALAASYDLTWLTALPAAQSLLQVDTLGQITASTTLANNVNLKLQGTGYLQHGNRKVTIPVLPNVVSSGGVVSFSTSTSGASVPATTTARFPLFGIPGNARIQSVIVQLGNTVLSATYTLETSDLTGAGGVYTAVPGASATTNFTPTLTPSTPAVLTDGFCSWIKVATGGGATAVVLSFTVTYDVP